MKEDSGAFKGKNLFSTIEWITSYALLIAVMVIVLTGMFDILPLFCLIIFIYLLTFVAIQQYAIRINTEKYAGTEILDGWMDVDYNKGEDVLLPIQKIDDFPAISPNARNAVDIFVKEMGKAYKKLKSDEFVQKFSNKLDKLENKIDGEKEK